MGSAIVEMEQLLDRGQGGETYIDHGWYLLPCMFFVRECTHALTTGGISLRMGSYRGV